MPRLVAAAVCRNGEVVTGRRHGDCMREAVLAHSWAKPVLGEETGFVDENGIYYSREDALVIAIDAGQVKLEDLRSGVLYSEDLW